MVSIIKDLFSPYNIPVYNIDRIWDDASDTDSNEYEWGTCSNATTDIPSNTDTIPLSQEEHNAEDRSLEFGPQNIYDAEESEQKHYEQVYMEDNTIEDLDEILDFFKTKTNHDETSVLTLTVAKLDPSNDSLPLVFPDLIDWDEPEIHDIPIFPNDESIIHYLCTVNLKIGSTSKQSNNIGKSGSAKSLSRKNEINK